MFEAELSVYLKMVFIFDDIVHERLNNDVFNVNILSVDIFMGNQSLDRTVASMTVIAIIIRMYFVLCLHTLL